MILCGSCMNFYCKFNENATQVQSGSTFLCTFVTFGAREAHQELTHKLRIQSKQYNNGHILRIGPGGGGGAILKEIRDNNPFYTVGPFSKFREAIA